MSHYSVYAVEFVNGWMLYCSYHLSEGSAKGTKSTQVIRQKCDENAANIWYKEADSITER